MEIIRDTHELLVLRCSASLLGSFLHLEHDTDYRFSGTDKQLIVRWPGGEKVIDFARILRAEVYSFGSDSDFYAIRLKLRNPREELDLQGSTDEGPAKQLADRINQFLKAHRDKADESIDLADADNETLVNAVWDSLDKFWNGPPSEPPAASSAPVRRDGPVLFVCPKCGWQTTNPEGAPPHECGRCRTDGGVVHLQDRSPNRAILVSCACGVSFSVPVSFAGMKRPCPKCGQKCQVPNR